VHFEPHPEEQATIARARALREKGLSVRKVSARLAKEGRFSRAGTPFAVAAMHKMLGGAQEAGT
jgi:hypothetical protein